MPKRFFASLTLAVMAAAPALAEGYPDRPITIIAPFAAGSGTDAIARIYAQALAEELGQPVVVENKPGAAASLGTAIVANAEPDGYTLQVGGTSSHSAVRSLLKDVPYDPVADFDAVAGMVEYPYYLLVKGDAPYNDLQGLIDHGKANPGTLSYGHGNALGRLAGGVLNSRAAFDAAEIAYPSTPPAIQDLLGGNIDYMFSDATAVVAHLKSGAMKAIANASVSRSNLLPEIPTLEEAGLPSFTLTAWNGIFGPDGMPAEATARLQAAMTKISAAPAFQERLAGMGVEIIDPSEGPLSKRLTEDVARWSDYATLIGLQPQ